MSLHPPVLLQATVCSRCRGRAEQAATALPATTTTIYTRGKDGEGAFAGSCITVTLAPAKRWLPRQRAVAPPAGVSPPAGVLQVAR